MGDQAQARMLSAAFPTPPPFYKHFTKANLSRLRQLRKEAGSQETTDDTQQDESLLDDHTLPSELRYLVPPSPPADGKWRSFGIEHDLTQPTQTLESAGIPQLYPSLSPTRPDPSPHLLQLTRSILLNFLELVGVLSINPEHQSEKIEHLQNLFYNVHDLINQYRPHQARESLILMMEERVERAREEVESIREGRRRVGELLGEIGRVGRGEKVEEVRRDGGGMDDGDEVDGVQRNLWNDLLDEKAG